MLCHFVVDSSNRKPYSLFLIVSELCSPYLLSHINVFEESKRFKGCLVGRFQHCIRRLIVLLPPNEFLYSSPEAPRTIQGRETSTREGMNYYQGIYLANPEFTKVLGSFTYRKSGTWNRFFHFPSEGRHAEDYSDTRKIGFGRVRTRELGYQRPAC